MANGHVPNQQMGLDEYGDPPGMQECRNSMRKTAGFYHDLKGRRSGSRLTTHQRVESLFAKVAELEESLLTYGGSDGDLQRRSIASSYADSFIPIDFNHRATHYAHSEVMIRKLELLCLFANRNVHSAFVDLLRQQVPLLERAESDWRLFLAPPNEISDCPMF